MGLSGNSGLSSLDGLVKGAGSVPFVTVNGNVTFQDSLSGQNGVRVAINTGAYLGHHITIGTDRRLLATYNPLNGQYTVTVNFAQDHFVGDSYTITT